MEADHKGRILMQMYEMGRLLGKGTFAKVYHARHLKTSQSVAIKVIDKERVVKYGLIEQIKREVSVMKMLKHPNIVQLYEVLATKSKIYLVLEYVKGGELFEKVLKGRLKEDVSRKYFQQLIAAVAFCHSRGACHRDLKPENLLLDEKGDLKISDFGLSALAESRRQDGLLHTVCGTPAYVAPEVISRKGYDGAKADIWSCGVILFALMAGHLPFNDASLMEMYKKIGKAEFKFPSWFSPDIRKLLTRILDPCPSTRVTIGKIMENPWFRRGLDSKLLRNNLDAPVNLPVDASAPFTPTDSVERKPEAGKITNLNAFHIISFSNGFDLSGMFEETDCKKEMIFTSDKSASVIISKLEDAAIAQRLKVAKKDGGLLKIEGSRPGRKGVLGIDAEVFEVTPTFHLVEMKKVSGDTMEYHKMLKQDLRPALKDVVWAWYGEHQQSGAASSSK